MSKTPMERALDRIADALETQARQASKAAHPSNQKPVTFEYVSNLRKGDVVSENDIVGTRAVTFDTLLDPVHGQALLTRAAHGKIRIDVSFEVPAEEFLCIDEPDDVLLISSVRPE